MEDIEIFNADGILPENENFKTEIRDISGNAITADNVKNAVDTDLIKRAMDGDKKAFNELYMQSYRYVFFVARQYIPDDETTYDAIQETFIKVYKGIKNLRSPDAFFGWISAVAKNTAIDILRASRYQADLSYEQSDESQTAVQTNSDVSLDIETVLKKLSADQAELLSLVYYDGMRVSQIAKMQGVPATTVYSRLNKAKRNLKSQLAAHGIDKAIYSGNFVAMVTTAIRNIIGTALLSFAIAQQILSTITGKRSKKELAVARIIKAHQKKLALKIASCLVAVSIFASCFTVLTLTDWGRAFKQKVTDSVKETVETVTEYHYYDDTSDTDSSQGQTGGFWQNLFGGNSSKDDTSSAESQTSSGSFWGNLFGTDSETSQQSSSNLTDSSPNFWQNLFSSDDKNSSYETESDQYTSSENNTHQTESETTSDAAVSENESVSQSGASSNASSTTSTVSGFTPPTVPEDFVPDCEPSQYNTTGNLAHNITLHYGKVARQGDWIYYAADAEEHWLVTNLYKVKTDGTQKQTLVVNIYAGACINVVGEWIYFIGGHVLSQYYLARVRTDGTGYQQLTDFKVDRLQVIGNTAYFYKDYTSEYGDYCKMNLKTGEITVLVEDIKDPYICITDKYFLYRPDGVYGALRVYDNKTGSLVHDFKVRGIQVYYNKVLVDDADGLALYDLDNLGAKPVKLSKYVSSLFESGNFLFYSHYKGGMICDQIKTADGQSNMGVLSLSDYSFKAWPFSWNYDDANDFTSYSTFDDGYVYCIVDTGLYRSYPDGSNCVKLG